MAVKTYSLPEPSFAPAEADRLTGSLGGISLGDKRAAEGLEDDDSEDEARPSSPQQSSYALSGGYF